MFNKTGKNVKSPLSSPLDEPGSLPGPVPALARGAESSAVSLAVSLAVLQPDCLVFPCQEECCSHGCDVWPRERESLLEAGLAAPSDFSEEPYEDDEGDLLFRTSLGGRGCVFLNEGRGCRLHPTGLKPEVCVVVPRSVAEADEMAAEGMLPCRTSWGY